ncbi:DNA polymerase III subunit beta [Campylobacterota bacterium]|nr:DNA polymerase III subunit beta [Campylobacterota bacterium]
MKLTIGKETLENLLSTLQPFLEKKDNSEIRAHILFQIDAQQLSLKATDLEIALSLTTTEFSSSDKGGFTCHGKKILDIVRTLKDGDITIEKEGDTVLLKQNRSKYKLPSFNADVFPKFDETTPDAKINIDSQKLINALKKISPVIPTNNPKYELNGALIDVRTNMINIVSTDTKRLAIFRVEQAADKNLQVILPKKAISEIQKMFNSNIDIFYNETNFVLVSENVFFLTKLINGKFPDYERIIPRELAHTFELSTEKMIDAIRQVSIVSAEIKITFEDGQISFETLEQNNEEAKTGFETENKLSAPITIAVNSKFLLDFLTQCQSETFVLALNEPNMPFIVKSEQFATIVMPIIL